MLTALAIALGCAATVDDVRRRAVSNWITGTALVTAVACHALRAGLPGVAFALGGAGMGFAVFLTFYLLGAMGAGDVKLMAAFGALLGPVGILIAAVLTAIAGALTAGAWLIWDRNCRAIPYAPAIVAGSWLALWGGG
jgi:prepilin peptidase CpaA